MRNPFKGTIREIILGDALSESTCRALLASSPQ